MKILFLFSLLIIFLSCDGGLTLPPDVQPGIEGTITLSGSWPPEDSVKSLWIFASQIFPLDSSKVVAGIIDGRISIYPSVTETLPYNVSPQQFNMPLLPGTYFYIGVLQRHGDLANLDSYDVVGVLRDDVNPMNPRSISVGDFQVISGLAIQIDFYNLPPQPF
ncbi:MAG: hypothetical protein WEB33_06515 [Bacteroidota bacterium]